MLHSPQNLAGSTLRTCTCTYYACSPRPVSNGARMLSSVLCSSVYPWFEEEDQTS